MEEINLGLGLTVFCHLVMVEEENEAMYYVPPLFEMQMCH
jgi:hypothetical protein